MRLVISPLPRLHFSVRRLHMQRRQRLVALPPQGLARVPWNAVSMKKNLIARFGERPSRFLIFLLITPHPTTTFSP